MKEKRFRCNDTGVEIKIKDKEEYTEFVKLMIKCLDKNSNVWKPYKK